MNGLENRFFLLNQHVQLIAHILWNLQAIDGLYCVGDSCFPGQGVIAVAFSGVMCAHRVAADIGKQGFRCLLLYRMLDYDLVFRIEMLINASTLPSIGIQR